MLHLDLLFGQLEDAILVDLAAELAEGVGHLMGGRRRFGLRRLLRWRGLREWKDLGFDLRRRLRALLRPSLTERQHQKGAGQGSQLGERPGRRHAVPVSPVHDSKNRLIVDRNPILTRSSATLMAGFAHGTPSWRHFPRFGCRK